VKDWIGRNGMGGAGKEVDELYRSPTLRH
jgi:hypothetical protein